MLFYTFYTLISIINRCIGAALAFLREGRIAYQFFLQNDGLSVIRQNMNAFDGIAAGVILITLLLSHSRSYTGKIRCIIVVSIAVCILLLHLAIVSFHVAFASLISFLYISCFP